MSRRVLCYSPGRTPFQRLMADAVDSGVLDSVDGRFLHGELSIECLTVPTPEEVLASLARDYVHLLVVDLRGGVGAISRGRALLDVLDNPDDVEARYGFHRIIALVSGDDAQAVDRLTVELGRRGIGTVLREYPDEPEGAFALVVVMEVIRQLAKRIPGKTAVAASGGGVTGIYFELGALKCLDDCMTPGVNQLDMFFGISAGAVVTSMLVQGYSPDEIMAAIAGHGGGRVPRLDLRLLRLGHLNFPDLGRRMWAATDVLWRALYDVAWHRSLPSANDLFLDYTSLVGPPLRSDGFERVLSELFSRAGTTNDFRELPRPLFVGASDQDARRPVVFGSEEYDYIPISLAVQASLSVNPAFAAVQIDGRYYEDGAVTRTSDFVEAIERGADLVLVVDPFLPYVSRQVGANNRRGILYNIDQDIRSMSYTRFENTRNWVLRQRPEVSSYTFLPSNRVRRILSVNPMDHRPFLAIWKGAYLSTFQRIERLSHRMRGDFAVHGIKLELDRARAVADRLAGTADPAFADFFPDARVELRTPPLCRTH